MTSISAHKNTFSHKKEKLYRFLFENHPDLVLITDPQGIILESNGNKLERALSEDGVIMGKNLLAELNDENRRKISSKLPDLLVGHNVQLECFFEKAYIPFHALITFVPFEEKGNITGFFIQVKNTTTKFQQEQEDYLKHNITLNLSKASSLSSGMEDALRLLCEVTNFHYGECWMPMFGLNYLVMKSHWHVDPSLSLFADVSKSRKFMLPGELPPIFKTMEACFCGNLQESAILNRKELAVANGLQSFLSIPLVYQGSFIGAVILFSKAAMKECAIPPKKLQTILNRLGAEIEKRKASEELDKFFNLTPDLFGIIGMDGSFKKINPAFEHLLGFTKEEFFALPFINFIHPEDRAITREAVARSARGIATEDFGIRCKKKNGDYVWISWTNHPAPEEGLIYTVGRDISTHKKQQEEIERINVAVESSSDAIVIAGPHLEVIYMNGAFQKLLGWTPSMSQGKGFKSFFAEEDIRKAITKALDDSGRWKGDVLVLDIHNIPQEFNLRIDPVKNQEGDIINFVAIFTDVREHRKAEKRIVNLSKAIEETFTEIYLINHKTRKFSYANKRAQENLGYKLEELKEIALEKIAPEYPIEKGEELVRPILEGKCRNVKIKTFHVRKGGTTYPIEATFSILEDGDTPSIMLQVVDITERVMAEEALQLSNERYQLVTKATHDAIWDWDLVTGKVFRGEGFYTLFGLDINEQTSIDTWKSNIHPDDAKMAIEKIFKVLHTGTKQWISEYRFKCKNGSYKYVRDRAYTIYDATGKAVRMTGALTDISDQKRNEMLLKGFNAELEVKVYEKTTRIREVMVKMQKEMDARIEAEKVLQDSLHEKEILLKEIHHRVKNNMAIISGLLSLQARQIQQPELKALFTDSQSRIKSMALIHEHLYQNRNLSRINFKEYMKELMEGISKSFPNQDKIIGLELFSEDYEMDILHAVPCGLILNELVTNCFKYAFTEKQKGLIKVSFFKEEDMFVLKVADNGIGLATNFNMAHSKSLGLKLVCNLSQQIGGDLRAKNNEGAVFIVKFPA